MKLPVNPRPCLGDSGNRHTIAARQGPWWELGGSGPRKNGHTSPYGRPQQCRRRETTAMTETDPSSTNRKGHGSARLCSKLRLLVRVTRRPCQDLDACFKPYRLPSKGTKLPLRSPQPCGIRIKTNSWSSAWTKRLLYIEIA